VAESPDVLIRLERAGDVDRIDEVHRQAFAGASAVGAEPVEVGLVRALRADRGWVGALSLVAEAGGGHVTGHVIGHVQARALDRHRAGLRGTFRCAAPFEAV
jgi:predicted N-acetyltransferase YhbS